MTEAVSLLPPSSTPYETAVSLTSAGRHPWPAGLIRSVWDPDTCPAHLLGHLAWAMSVDIWDDGWDDAVKRGVIARSLDLHRRKGTLSAIRDHIELAGGRLVEAIVPPQGFFASDDFEATDPVWRRWLRGLPEIRINRVQAARSFEFGLAAHGGVDAEDMTAIFLGDEADTPTWFAGGDPAPAEIEYATLVDDGVETAISMLREPDPRRGRRGEVVRFGLTLPAGAEFYADDESSVDGAVVGDGRAAAGRGALAVALGPAEEPDQGWNLVSIDIDRIQDIQPEAGVMTFADPVAYAIGDALEDRVFGEVDPTYGTWLGLRLMGLGPSLPPAASFCDVDRLGMDPYTAELLVDLSEPASPDLLVADAGFADAAAAAGETDTSRLDAVIEAALSAKAARDRIYLDLDIQPAGRSLSSTDRLSDLKIW